MERPTKLGNGWVCYISRSKKKPFYYNVNTKKRQWTEPTIDNSEGAKRPKLKTSCDHIQRLRGEVRRSFKVGGSKYSSSGQLEVFHPWKHQVEAVASILEQIEQTTPSTSTRMNFLIQHTTGSGKSMTISALAHRLLYVQDEANCQFHTIILLVDRIHLNSQLDLTVRSFLKRNGVEEFACATSVENLAQLLGQRSTSTSRQHIILTTIHKFSILMEDPVLVTKLLLRKTESSTETSKYQRLAIITDEAHRSHGKNTRHGLDNMLKRLGNKHQALTYIGFSATPEEECLDLFSSTTDNRPFHLYSMAEAIANGHVLNVLTDYTFIRVEIELAMPPAIKEQLKEQNLWRHIINEGSTFERIFQSKINYILKDFQALKEKNAFMKGMIVARSRKDVTIYHKLLLQTLNEQESRLKVYCCFSSQIEDAKGSSVKVCSEKTINRPGMTLENADLIVVCDKLDTGYNEPRLSAMYIDRCLNGSSSKAVQLLSRLNRRMEGKSSVHVVDFVNHPCQILKTFSKYWNPKTHATESIDQEKYELYKFASIILEMMPQFYSTSVIGIVKTMTTLERDVHKQFYSALTSYHQLCKQMKQQHKFVDLRKVNQVVDQCQSLKPITNQASKDFCAKVVGRMATRVRKMVTLFSGSLDPDEYLVWGKHKEIFLEKISPQDVWDFKEVASGPWSRKCNSEVDALETVLRLEPLLEMHRTEVLTSELQQFIESSQVDGKDKENSSQFQQRISKVLCDISREKALI